MRDSFHKFAARVSWLTGTAQVFLLALLMLAVWGFTGPAFNFSEGWLLFITTIASVITYLMVFLIQNTQVRDSKVVQLKLDELIRATRGRDALVDLEDMTDEELDELDREFRAIHEQQATSMTMRKLHEHIATAHRRRLSAKKK